MQKWLFMRKPRADLSWQEKGYHLQPHPCERAAALDDDNDTDYTLHVSAPAARRDPFSAEESDPAMRRQRSKSLLRHAGSFWQSAKGSDAYRKRVQRIIEAALLLAIIAGVIWGLFSTVFAVRSVTVEGNHLITDAQVLGYAKVRLGSNMWLIDDEAIGARLQQNRYLSLISVEKQFPGSVVLHVRERTQDAYLRYCGITYILDSRGMVLEETDNAAAQPAMLKLEGLKIKSCDVGKRIALYDDQQLTVCREIMVELRVLGLEDEVTELYIGDDGTVTIATSSGYSVRMGDAARIHEKLRAMLLVCASLRESGRTGGTVDVSTPEEPTWIPGIDSPA